MATPMITCRGGYPMRYAKPVASARLAARAQQRAITSRWRAWLCGELAEGDAGEMVITMTLDQIRNAIAPLKEEIAELRGRLSMLTDLVGKGGPAARH
jgi:hypothetical protein